MEHVLTIRILLVFQLCQGLKNVVDSLNTTTTGEQRLLENITARIHPQVRPVINPGDPVVVKMGLALNQIIDLEEKVQILTTMTFMRLYWQSENLKWDPKDFGGVKSIRLPPEKVWVPDIVIYNFASSEITHQMMFNVQVFSDGSTMWLYPALFKTTCIIDISQFPYDQQNCKLTFGSWTYDGTQVDITNRSATGDTSIFVGTGEWEIIGMPTKRNVAYYACCTEPYPTLDFTIVMRRRSLYYLFNLLLPCVVITAITIVGFYLPPASGEKVSLSITILLSLTVFMLIVAESMPASSESIPLIGWIFAVAIMLVAASSSATVLILGVYYRGTHGREVPDWLKKLAYCLAVIVFKKKLVKSYGFWTSGKVAGYQRRRHPSTESVYSNEKVHENGNIQFTRHIFTCEEAINGHHNGYAKVRDFRNRDLQQIAQNTEKLLGVSQERQANEKLEEDWHLVAMVLDRFFLLVFMIVCICLVAFVFGYKPDYD